MTQLATRGTTNRNDRGSTYTRAARRKWLIETYRADVNMLIVTDGPAGAWSQSIDLGAEAADWCLITEAPFASVVPACRCYRCGTLLTEETLTVDRIVPGCMGGTYRRTNIRPACGPCNIHTGNQVRDSRRSR
jgi:hypothetical protein